MSNTTLLTVGYVGTVVLYGAYWASLQIRINRRTKRARQS